MKPTNPREAHQYILENINIGYLTTANVHKTQATITVVKNFLKHSISNINR